MKFNEGRASLFLFQSDEMVSRLARISSRLQDPSIYEDVRQHLKSIVPEEVEVHFFGSRIIGLATEESDLDIFMDMGCKFHSQFSNKDDSCIDTLAQQLKRSSHWRITQIIRRATVPIIASVYLPRNLKCDFSFINGLSVCNSNLLGHLFRIQPEAIKLFHFVREWMKSQGFDCLKGYTVALLVLFFLQQKNLMPSVKVVQQGLRVQKIAGYEIQFDPNRSLQDYRVNRMVSYKNHVRKFFAFYSTFNFHEIISTYEGLAISSFIYKDNYRKFLFEGIYLPGPINKGLNCGNYWNDQMKSKFVELCKDSKNYLAAHPNELF